jgi:FtsH-binding integral membrane protein
MQQDRFPQVQTRTGVTYDAGLRAHFQRVYNTMALGLLVTGAVAYGVAAVPQLLAMFHGTILGIVVALAPLGIIFFGLTPRKIHSMSLGMVNGLYYLLTALFGVSLAYIFAVYSGESIARVFFITAGMFAATSVFGYVTKKDLSGMGGLMIMGLIGILIASIVNIFLQSSMVMFVTSVIGVIVFTGLIAWDTQNIKETYREANGAESNAKLAVMGSLSLYLNFINLFMMLLRLMGSQRN